MYRLLTGVSILAISGAFGATAMAQDAATPTANRLDEVIVTATKRTTGLQDTAVTVAAINGEALDQLGVKNLTDYLVQLPGVTAGGAGPGQSTIYIRGLASTTPNLTTAGVAGLAPNVAFYLDEQPLA